MVLVVGFLLHGLVIAVYGFCRSFQQLHKFACFEVTPLLYGIRKSQGCYAGYVRAGHGSAVHITVSGVAVVNQGRENGTGSLAGSRVEKFRVVFSDWVIIFRISSRSGNIYFHAEVGVGGGSEIGGYRTYGYTLGVCSRIGRDSCILVSCGENCDTAVDYAVGRTGIVDEIVQ